MRQIALCCVFVGELSAATWNVPPGGTLQSTMDAAANGDTILLQAGTYTTTEATFHIRKPLTVAGVGPATVIQSPTNGTGIEVTASNVTIERVRIAPALYGIVAGGAGRLLAFVVLRDILIDSATLAHGIFFRSVRASFIQRCRVTSAYANGILLDEGSVDNVVANNTIQSTQTQHAIAIRNSDRNTVVNNIVTGSGFHGIIVVGAQFNRIHNNNISGQAYDGIMLTWNGGTGRPSTGNYVGQNTIAGNLVRTDGTGIRMNYGANGTYVFGNVQYGAVAGGISSFNADSNWIRGNVTSSDGQAGVLIWKFDQQLKRNEYTTVHNNLVYNQTNTNGILFRGSWFNEAAWNYVTNSGAGLSFEGLAGASGENTLFENTVQNVGVGLLIDSSNRSTRVYRNRFMGITENYIFEGAEAVLDASKWLGGNYWSEHPSTQPYSKFITRTVPSVQRSGAYVDRFPFPDETLGHNFSSLDDYSIVLDAPVQEAVIAAGSQKTIAWRSKGCALVDLSYFNFPLRGSPIPIATNYPDHGFFQWTVPSVTPDPSWPGWQIRADCKDSAGRYLTASVTAGFRIATGDLRLLAPGPNVVLDSGQPTRVVWAQSGAVQSVDVLYRIGLNPWTPFATNISVAPPLATNVNGDNVIVSIPYVGSPRAQFMVRATNNPDVADTTDGYVVFRSGPAGIFFPSGFTGFAYTGDAMNLEWVSPPRSGAFPSGSTFVSIDLWDSVSKVFRPVTRNLPDFGRYRWLVPELYMTGAYLRWTFKDAQGAMLVQDSAPFSIRYSSTIGTRVPFYRLYSPVAGEHLYTTLQAEYNYLGANGWIQERTVGDIVDNALTAGSPEVVPLYRLFNNSSAQHLWTTDRNEYFTLRELPNWTPENFAGYLFQTQIPATIPFLRLIYPFPPYPHHWTSSACEHNYLRTVGWISEGIVGYVFANADTDNLCTEQPVLSSAPPVLTSQLRGGLEFPRLAPTAAPAASGASTAESFPTTLALPPGSDSVLNTPETLVEAGDVLTILLNGEGLLDAYEPEGALLLAVDFNETPAEVLSAEATAHGAVELRFRVPPGLPSGAVSVLIRSLNAMSGQSITVFVR